MLVTDAGISIDVNELQSKNAPAPMLVTDVGISIDVSELQCANISAPMLVNWLPSAKVTVISDLQPWNA